MLIDRQFAILFFINIHFIYKITFYFHFFCHTVAVNELTVFISAFTGVQMNLSVTFSNGTTSFNEGFYLTAFQTLPTKNYLILGLAIIYIITLLGNLVLLSVVLMNSSLQNPKYLAVCNLAVVDISINSVIIPQMVPVFVFNQNYISFGACFSQMFFMHFFGDMESFSLALLAYDRLIAICWPLRYSTINTNLRMLLIIALIWILVTLLDIFPVIFASRLPYCSSRAVLSCCCEHGPVYRLACTDTTYNRQLGTVKTMITLLGPLFFIVFTYVIVVIAVMRIASVTQRWKAFHTCLTHMMLVMLYYMPVIIAYVLGNLRLVQNVDLLTAILTVSVTVPAMLNPIIYSLKTDELKDRMVKLFRQSKVAQQIIKTEVKALQQ
ncbi:odorant receptor 107-1 [Danio rerio]|uniref:Odorant receptor 107-1 n=1 Tax=Danio rerio TaxID=7955 RepID=Q9I8Y8_DANRE|nr:odorant receptor 107-1 [Danio rerio]AAF27276.1 odorant receptor 7.1 [Danio rerio]|eukprot:NP_571825.1 odorant receptor, family D, subfamily 107, member 1 [Danio rerio]